jgi:hypothetical protein
MGQVRSSTSLLYEDFEVMKKGVEAILTDSKRVSFLEICHHFETVEHQLLPGFREIQNTNAAIFGVSAYLDIARIFKLGCKPAHRLLSDTCPFCRCGYSAARKVDIGEQDRVRGAQIGVATSLQAADDVPIYQA